MFDYFYDHALLVFVGHVHVLRSLRLS
jgi:hypothetical protein